MGRKNFLLLPVQVKDHILILKCSKQKQKMKMTNKKLGERGGSVVECRTPEREVRGSRPTAAVLCP